MAKGKKARPGRGPNSSVRAIGKAIISEWIAIIQGGTSREMSPQALGAAIRNELVSGGGGPLEVGIITDPVHRETDANGQDVKFIWVCIPAPEELTEAWLLSSGYATMQGGNLEPSDAVAEDLGEAVLFGCGR